MKWYDAAEDNERNAKANEAGQDLPQDQRPGLVFRADDGTPMGLWRVTAEDMTPGASPAWVVWDMRRTDGTMRGTRPVKVFARVKNRDLAFLLAEVAASSRGVRVALAGHRSVKAVIHMLSRTPVVRIADMVFGGIPRAIADEWRRR